MRLRVVAALLLGALLARPAWAVRITSEIFLGDLNDVFFGAGDPLVFVIDPVTGATTIDEDATHIDMLGMPMMLSFSGAFDSSTGVYAGAGFIDAPQISVETPTDHADGQILEAGATSGPVDVRDGVGIGAPVSLFMMSGCDLGGGGGAAPQRAVVARHFIECEISLFLSGSVVAEDFSDVDCATVPDGARCEDGNACTGGDVCQGGACVAGSPISCDDGDPCTADDCAPATGCVHSGGDGDGDGVCDADDNCPRIANADQTDADPVDGIGDACECRAPAPGICVLDGAGDPANECALETLVDPAPAILPRTGRPASKVECRDGAACDLDGMVNRSCRFRVAVCLNNRDPRIGCAPRDLEKVRLRRPTRVARHLNEAQAAAGLLAALADVAPSVVEGRYADEVRFTPVLAASDLCTRRVEIDVPLRGPQGRLRILTRTSGARPPGASAPPRDNDRLRLTCLE